MTRMKEPEQTNDALQTALDLVGKYIVAMNNRSSIEMDHLRSPDFELDFVYGDAYQSHPMSKSDTGLFWPAWFRAFPDGEFESTRTIAAETVVVVQWTFSGSNDGVLGEPILNPSLPGTGRIVCFRGVSIYDIREGQIARETTYLDLATVMVELGVTL